MCRGPRTRSFGRDATNRGARGGPMRASTSRISIAAIAVVLALLYAPAALAQAPTETTVTSAPNPSRVGETVTLNARVSVPGVPAQRPTGTVEFEVDGTAVGAR